VIELIPAIDLIEGKCVRLTQGDYGRKTVYNESPLEVARQFEDLGITRVHLVDLDGARKGEVVNIRVLDSLANATSLKIDFGGGLKTEEDIARVFNAGAALATVGSIAVKNQPLFFSWIKKFGPDRMLLGADVKDEKIAISGWKEKTDLAVLDFIRQNTLAGVHTLFCTDISRDGMLQGPSTELYEKILKEFPELNLIASGGVASMEDVYRLEESGCCGVIIGKAIYEGKIKVSELKSHLKN
jgi:phosphoribosylformimino-5-aminoimidazole carboxamide ribotide isomerase